MPKGGKVEASTGFEKVDLKIVHPKTLLIMVRSPEVDVRTEALKNLDAYCGISIENRRIIELEGAIPILIDLFENEEEDRDVKAIASLCLSTLMEDRVVRDRCRKSNVKLEESLKTLLTSDCTDGEPAMIETILNLLNSPDPDVIKNCVGIITKAMEDYGTRCAFKEYNERRLLAELYSNDIKKEVDVSVASCCSYAIASLAESKSNSEVIGNLNGLGLLLQFAFDADEGLARAAIYAIKILLREVELNRYYLVRDGGVVVLIKLLGGNYNGDVRANAAESLYYICQSRDGRQLVTDDINVRRYSILAMSLCAKNQGARTEMLLNGAIKTFCSMIGAKDHETSLGAGVAIRICAEDKGLAEYMCSIGVLNRLYDIKALLQHPQNYAFLAIEALFASVPSAKYFFTGKLDFEDKIESTFYDMGLSRGSQFIDLQSLKDPTLHPLDALRPVFVVSRPSEMSYKIGSTGSKQGENRLSSERILRRIQSGLGPRAKSLRDLNAFVPDLKHQEPNSSTFKTDEDLDFLISRAREILDLQTPEEKVMAVAKLVVNHTGGRICENVRASFRVSTHLNDLREMEGTNCIYLGKIRKGGEDVRALLFKVIADAINAFPVSLIRDKFSCWNV
eukprot:UC4_evm3s173